MKRYLLSMPVVFLLATSIFATGEDPAAEAKIKALPAGADAIAGKTFKDFKAKGEANFGKIAVVPVEGMHFKEAMRITTEKGPEGPRMATKFNTSLPTTIPFNTDDIVTVSFYARATKLPEGSDKAIINLATRRVSGEKLESGRCIFYVGKDWKKCYTSFRMLIKNKDLEKAQRFISGAGDQSLVFNQCVDPQEIEIADIKWVSYGKSPLPLSSFPQTYVTYGGRESDASWRKAADERIDKIRKADLSVQVVDSAGAPVTDANVHVAMKRHAFRFGTAAGAMRILDDKTGDGEKYLENLLKLFNHVSFESGTFQFNWDDPQDKKDTLAMLSWLDEHGMTSSGNFLVWPSWRKNKNINQKDYKDPEKLRKYLRDSITQRVTDLKGRLFEWNTVNEAHSSFDFIKILGEEEMSKWFETARAADPKVMLNYNENTIIGFGEDPESGSKLGNLQKHVQGLIDRKAPITGIGLQSHCGWGMLSPDEILKTLAELDRFGLKIVVTEFDFGIYDEDLQGDYTRDFLTTLFSHPSVIEFTMWGFWDGQHIKFNAPIFRKDWSIKPSGQQYMDLVLKKWWTDTTGKSDAKGTYSIRGFMGDYEITVEANGKKQTEKAVLAKDGATIKVILK
ncbi:MAG: hypothetical protein A2X48_02035 [Lentisphaerae bacterium GWF2_49_21]|nr:MAG: hypothetical protein A2X48_02035 [Lentisphaerae bacterium GWF2_49_21]